MHNTYIHTHTHTWICCAHMVGIPHNYSLVHIVKHTSQTSESLLMCAWADIYTCVCTCIHAQYIHPHTYMGMLCSPGRHSTQLFSCSYRETHWSNFWAALNANVCSRPEIRQALSLTVCMYVWLYICIWICVYGICICMLVYVCSKRKRVFSSWDPTGIELDCMYVCMYVCM